MILLHHILPLPFKIPWKPIEKSLQKITTKKTFSSPPSPQNYFLDVKTIGCDIIKYKINSFVFDFLVKKSLVKSLHEGIIGLVRVLNTSNEVVTFPDTCLFGWRIVLNIRHWKISIENLIEPLFSNSYPNFITILLYLIAQVDFYSSRTAIFGTHNLNLYDLTNVLMKDFHGRLLDLDFRLIRKFIEYF